MFSTMKLWSTKMDEELGGNRPGVGRAGEPVGGGKQAEQAKGTAGLLLKTALAVMCGWVVLASAGCSEPGSIGRFRATPVTNIILDSLGVVDEEPAPYANARDPEARDLIAGTGEYVIGAGDMLEISIFELFGADQEWRDRKRVADTGRIILPEVGTFQAAGRTELELMDDISDKLVPNVIRRDPKVSVTVIGSRAQMFTISGAVDLRGQYPLNGPDFRIAEALATAGGAPLANADYAYVIRRVDMEALRQMEQRGEGEQAKPELPPLPAAPGSEPSEKSGQDQMPERIDEEQELLESIAPTSARADWGRSLEWWYEELMTATIRSET